MGHGQTSRGFLGERFAYAWFGVLLLVGGAIPLFLMRSVVAQWPWQGGKQFALNHQFYVPGVPREAFALFGLLLLFGGLVCVSPRRGRAAVSYLRSIGWKGWLLLFALWLIPIHALNPSYPRRVGFFYFTLFLVGTHAPALRKAWKESSYYRRVTIGFLGVSFLVKALPGGYFPPFYGGIAGWTTLSAGRTETFQIHGVQLVRDDGERIWLSNAFIEPANFVQRQTEYVMGKVDGIPRLFNYYFLIYQRSYPDLLRNRYPTQALLGGFAYPGHNPYRMLNYRDFPPKRILAIEEVYERRHRADFSLVERQTSARSVIHPGVGEK